MSSRGRLVFYRRGSVSRGSGRGSPDLADSSNPHSGDGSQVDEGAEHSQIARGGGRGGRGAYNPRGGHARERGRGSIINAAPEVHSPQVAIDARIADDSDIQMVTVRHAAQRFTDSGFLLRPDFGTDGKSIALRTNFFPVSVPRGPLYEYVVDITGPRGRLGVRPIKQRVFHLAEQTAAWSQAGMHGNVAHDGNARLVSIVQLPQPLTIKVLYCNEGEAGPPTQGGVEYALSINITQQFNTDNLARYLSGELSYRYHNTLPELTAWNNILTSIPASSNIVLGRNRYFSVATAEPTGFGGILEARRGFQSILKPVHKQLMVRVGICTSLFHIPGNLARAMVEFARFSFGGRMDAFVKGLRIRTHLGTRKAIKRVVPLTARACSLDTLEYGHITVEDYFRQKYDIRLQYCDIPLVDVGFSKSDYLPAEVCDILPHQPFRGKLLGEHAATMSLVGRQPPNTNGMAIANHFRDQLRPNMTRPELRSIGVTVGQDMAVVPGRILPKPKIQYLSGAALINDQASWNLNGVKFAVGARLENWVVLIIKDGSRDEFAGFEDQDLRWVVARFCNMCNVSGMQVIGDPRYVTTQLPRKDPSDPLRRMAIDKIRNALLSVNSKPTIFLVVLADGDSAIYDGLKHLCDITLDVATVCVQSSKFRRSNPHYLANVALKTNMKLGGINHKLDPGSRAWLSSVPTMIIGICVTHPSPGSILGTPSVAAIVASVDADFVQYPVKLGIQESSMEIVGDLKGVMVDMLKLFQAKNNGKLPERIIIYRRGISENQSSHLITTELPQLREAFGALLSDPRYRPKVTIVICGMRNQVRFYPIDVKGAWSTGNAPPGTVVDRGVTDVFNFDFFLQSHGASLGTARPIHYTVIHDEIGFKADELQKVTHSLSYVFARATRSVRLASPASYAELASRRGRCYLRSLYLGVGTAGGETEVGTEEDVWQETQRLWGSGVSGAALKNTMFYL